MPGFFDGEDRQQQGDGRSGDYKQDIGRIDLADVCQHTAQQRSGGQPDTLQYAQPRGHPRKRGRVFDFVDGQRFDAAGGKRAGKAVQDHRGGEEDRRPRYKQQHKGRQHQQRRYDKRQLPPEQIGKDAAGELGGDDDKRGDALEQRRGLHRGAVGDQNQHQHGYAGAQCEGF
jgi:hypothetical protein